MRRASTRAPKQAAKRTCRVETLVEPEGALPLLATSHAVVIERWFSEDRCAAWVAGVYAAREAWTKDFGGEQFALGRAFYTHYEEGRSSAYFGDAAASDARVERHAPGLQGAMRELVARITGARAVARRGWCGPGVHVFPPGNPVAERGGVLHFDTEGLAEKHVAARRRALSIVAMLQPPEADGGIRVWDVLYAGHDHPTAREKKAPSAMVAYRTGDVIVFDSYRLHQIQPFGGARERISATVHAAEIDTGLWETWF